MPGEPLQGIARLLVLTGLALAGLGGLLWLAGYLPEGWRPGRLPGDVLIQRDGFTFYMPLTTMVLASLLLTGLMWLWRSW